MKRALNVILLVWVSVVFGSCNKSVFSNGAIDDRYDTIPTPFRIVELRDNVNVNLKLHDRNHIPGFFHIRTGERLIDNIYVEIDSSNSSKLIIGNNNTNNFLRPYDYPLEVDVYFDSIFKIIYNSNGIVHTDTIKGIAYSVHDSVMVHDSLIDSTFIKHKIQIDVDGGSGELHLLLYGDKQSVLQTNYSIGTADLFARGNLGYAETKTNYSCHGIVDYRDLEIHNHLIHHYGTNRIITKVFSNLDAFNYNNGEIYYVKYKKKTYEHFSADSLNPEHNDWVWNDCPKHPHLTGDRIFPLDSLH